MRRVIGSLALLVMCLGLMPTAVNAQICPAEGPQVVVYFDAEGTQRTKESPGVGVLDEVYIFGEGFPAAFISGIQYKVDYGPTLLWVNDLGLPPVTIGSSPTGIAMGFGSQPRPGAKFLIQRALVDWRECEGVNVDGPAVLAHPDLGPVQATRFPDFDVIIADGGRTQVCQSVELEIKPGGACPAPLSINFWKDKDGAMAKGGKLKVAVLGSAEGVNAFLIDLTSARINGAVPEVGFLQDVASANGSRDCNIKKSGDGRLDAVFEFRTLDVIAGIPTPNPKDEVELTLTGCYVDGMPFTCSNVVRIVGNLPDKFTSDTDTDDSDLSYPNPNPFNPVTRFSYSVPATQHVRLAVYDVAGRLVEELVNEVKGSGEYVVEWDAGTLPSGVYFYRLETGGKSIVRRATLLK